MAHDNVIKDELARLADKLEPGVDTQSLISNPIQVSQAISLKRIADALERKETREIDAQRPFR